MQRWIRILAIVLGVQVVLAGALMFRGDRLAPARTDAALVAGDVKGADKLSIDGPVSSDAAAKKTEATRVELVKHDGGWIMPSNFDAPADAKKVETVLKQLADARRGLPIATTAQALDRFKVGEHDYERRIVVSQGGKVLATVYLSAATGGRKANARTAQDSAVYNVDMATYDLPTGAGDWLDKTLLARDASKVTRIEVAEAGKPPLTLQRPAPVAGASKDAQGSDDGGADKNAAPPAATPAPAPAPAWSADGLTAGDRLDPAKADALVQAVANLHVSSVLGTQEQPDWQQDPPRLRVTIDDAAGKPVTWTIVKAKTGDMHVLKASDRPWYFELKSWDAQPLLAAAARDKLVVASAPAVSVPAKATAPVSANAGMPTPTKAAAK